MIDTEIREVLHRQAAALRVPDASPGDHRLIRLDEHPRSARRGRTLAAAAVLVALAGGGVWLLNERRDPPASANGEAAAFHVATPTVTMDAGSVEVLAGGRSWAPTADLAVNSDPGTLNEYTTLELSWRDGDTEQAINFYFTSDGTDWWANEIRTYDGNNPPEWVLPEARGEFMRSKLGSAFVGDLDLPNLRIRNLRLQAFPAPGACTAPTKPVALVLGFPTINSWVGGFGATSQVVDTATCAPLPIGGFTFEYASSDPSIVTIDPAERFEDYPPTLERIGLTLLTPGTATIHVTVRDAAGTVVDTGDMQVTVKPERIDPESQPLDSIAVSTTLG